jgi:hypothetical protein
VLGYLKEVAITGARRLGIKFTLTMAAYDLA